MTDQKDRECKLPYFIESILLKYHVTLQSIESIRYDTVLYNTTRDILWLTIMMKRTLLYVLLLLDIDEIVIYWQLSHVSIRIDSESIHP